MIFEQNMNTLHFRIGHLSLVAAVIGAFAGAFGCDPVDGTDPYALWDAYASPENSYHFHYLSPPWELTGETCSGCRILVAHQRESSLVQSGLPGDGSSYRFVIEAKVVEGMNAADAADHDAAVWLDRGATVRAAAAFENVAGDSGLRNSAEAEDRAIEAIYFDFGLSRAVAVTAVGKDRLDFSDMELLLESFEPRPAEE